MWPRHRMCDLRKVRDEQADTRMYNSLRKPAYGGNVESIGALLHFESAAALERFAATMAKEGYTRRVEMLVGPPCPDLKEIRVLVGQDFDPWQECPKEPVPSSGAHPLAWFDPPTPFLGLDVPGVYSINLLTDAYELEHIFIKQVCVVINHQF